VLRMALLQQHRQPDGDTRVFWNSSKVGAPEGVARRSRVNLPPPPREGILKASYSTAPGGARPEQAFAATRLEIEQLLIIDEAVRTAQ
jgi:hypothetical protein